MKVIVAGSRSITDYNLVKAAIEESGFEITEIISGHASMKLMEDGTWLPSVDRLAEQYSWDVLGKEPRIYPARWKEFGKKAGILRNTEMSKYGDALVAVWDGNSRGTAHMITTMQKLGKPVYVKHVE